MLVDFFQLVVLSRRALPGPVSTSVSPLMVEHLQVVAAQLRV